MAVVRRTIDSSEGEEGEGAKAALTRELMIRHNFKRSITPSARTCIERALNLTRQDGAVTAGTPKDKDRLLSTIRRQIVARKSPLTACNLEQRSTGSARSESRTRVEYETKFLHGVVLPP